MLRRMSELDLVLWGATGFTGRLVAEYLVARGPAGLRWALGGRDRVRLEGLRDAIGASADVVVGDATDPASLAPIVRRTRVVASTAGPYALYGTPLVEACVEAGIDYCDITGEVHWVRDNVDRLHDRAVKNGARIVHCCGFDSVPSDLGVWMLHEHFRERHGRRLARARFYLARVAGGFSGGTVASLLGVLEQAARDRSLRRLLANPYALNPEGERSGPDGPDQLGARHDERLGRWTAPFVMAAINTRVVRRTNALLGYPYGRDFRYGEVTLTRGRRQALGLALTVNAVMLAGWFAPTRWLLRRWAPQPGQGPSAEAREKGFFEVWLDGESEGDPALKVRVRVRGEHDPGYAETSRMLAESALCLALDRPASPGGILTPAACMGTRLLERLRAAGMTFETGDSNLKSGFSGFSLS